MILRPFLLEETACASYLLGCTSQGKLAVAAPHVDLVERYLEAAERAGGEIVAVFETHVQADHVTGLPALVAATGATAYLPPQGGGGDAPGPPPDRGGGGPGHTGGGGWGVCEGRLALGEGRGRAGRAGEGGAAAARAPPVRLDAPSPRAPRLRPGLSDPLRRLRLRPGALRQSLLDDRLRAAPQQGARLRRRRELRPRAPRRRAAAAGRSGCDRRGEPKRARADDGVTREAVRLGLRAKARQFALLVGLNAFVGAMVGLERSVLPLVGERDFGLTSKGAILSFVVAFGIAKACTNLAAGGLAGR